jgi:hypothetical protein
MSYATLAELKSSLGITDTVDDTPLQNVLDATDLLINNFCDTKVGFGQTASQTRYYTTNSILYAITDPIVSISELKTDNTGMGTYESTWDTSDYILAPRNAALDSRPYTEIDTNITQTKLFPTRYIGVKVTGVFGWPTVPAAVKQAELIQAGAVWASRTSPFGVIGGADLGGILRQNRALHPEAQVLLEPYRNRNGLAE